MATKTKKANQVAGDAGVEKATEGKVIHTLSSVVDNFTATLGVGDARFIKEEVQGIQADMKQMVESALSIGNRLRNIRGKIGAENFSKFMREVLPKVGVATSTGYRWCDKAEVLGESFTNGTIRHAIAQRAGDGLVTYGRKGDGSTDWSKHEVSPYYKAAIEQVAGPTGTVTPEKAAEYASAVVSAARKLQKAARVTDGEGKVQKAYHRIESQFDSFCENHGFANAHAALLGMFQILAKREVKADSDKAGHNLETLIGTLDKELSNIVKGGKGSKVPLAEPKVAAQPERAAAKAS